MLISEIQSIHVKDPKNPPRDLIERIKNEIKEIKYQESIYVQSTPSQPTPNEIAHLKDISTFYTAGKPYRLITPETSGEEFDKSLPPDELKMYDFTSTVLLPYAMLISGSQKADLSRIAPGMKGDPQPWHN